MPPALEAGPTPAWTGLTVFAAPPRLMCACGEPLIRSRRSVPVPHALLLLGCVRAPHGEAMRRTPRGFAEHEKQNCWKQDPSCWTKTSQPEEEQLPHPFEDGRDALVGRGDDAGVHARRQRERRCEKGNGLTQADSLRALGTACCVEPKMPSPATIGHWAWAVRPGARWLRGCLIPERAED